MELLDQRDPSIALAPACRALNMSRATLYRRNAPPRPKKPRMTCSPRGLSEAERQEVLAVLDSPEFVDQPPAEIYATLLSRGTYLASVPTMYRLLAVQGQSNERRRQRPPQTHQKPQLVATAPNQVWTWDITKVPGLMRGVFFYVYVILDLFSRYVVGWMAAERETGLLATEFLRETLQRHGVLPHMLTLHSDRGSPMTANSMVQLLATLGVSRSLSRPHVSDDNPFIESHFKTAKYQPDYPERFGGLLHVRAWFGEFFGWYTEHHHHEGLAYFTPAEVFFGRIPEVAAQRQAALDAAFAAHPERFVRGRPIVALPPTAVYINPLATPEALPITPKALSITPSPEPPPEAPLCPSPATAHQERAQDVSMARSTSSIIRAVDTSEHALTLRLATGTGVPPVTPSAGRDFSIIRKP
jgi:putative transposase